MKNRRKLFPMYLVVLSIVVGLVMMPVKQQAIVSSSPDASAQPRQLPIFRLAPPNVNEEMVRQQAKSTLGISGQATRTDYRLTIRSGPRLVDVNTRSGATWAADQSQMWNPKLRPALPDDRRAREIADKFVAQNRLLPEPDKNQLYSVSFETMGRTHAAVFDLASRKRSERKLDVQVIYSTKMNIRGVDNGVPLFGGGGEFNVTLGDQGKVIGFQGLWRPIEGVETESPVIPKEKADEQFRAMMKGMEIRSMKSYLAYYSAPPSVEQKFLYPVYVYSATAYIKGRLIPLRRIAIPATEFGPKRAEPRTVARPRAKNARPTRRSTMREGPQERGVKRPGGRPAHALQGGSWKEGGSSYIGVSGGLDGSQNNVQGFVDGLTADGWSINFVWGDANAFESDWRVNDDSWVDAADFVFYTGHADMNGWVLSNPDDGSLDFSEVGTSPENPGDMWGGQDLEWVIVAACGPLQDEVISPGGGDVFDRWDGAFDGLHQLLGYGAITNDNEQEGASVTDYTRGGDTIINAWFRAAREIQPGDNGAPPPDGPTVWVGVMYVGTDSADPFDDHIWEHGSVSEDPRSPTFYVAMWTTC